MKVKYIREQIEWLLESEITGYEIERETGVPRTSVSQLRKGDASLDNITLAKAEKLAEYAGEERKSAFERWRDCVKKYNNQPHVAMAMYEDVLKEVYEDKNTPQICLEEVKKDGGNLLYVPSDFRTEKICLEAVKHGGWIMQYVPEEIMLKSTVFCLKAVAYSADAIIFIPNEALTLEIGVLIANDEESFECLPLKLQKQVENILTNTMNQL